MWDPLPLSYSRMMLVCSFFWRSIKGLILGQDILRICSRNLRRRFKSVFWIVLDFFLVFYPKLDMIMSQKIRQIIYRHSFWNASIFFKSELKTWNQSMVLLIFITVFEVCRFLMSRNLLYHMSFFTKMRNFNATTAEPSA